jgi:hypothetical protein
MNPRQVPDLPAGNNRPYHNGLNRSLTAESETGGYRQPTDAPHLPRHRRHRDPRPRSELASSGTTVTETVYRKQIRPVITDGAEATDRLFPDDTECRTSGDEPADGADADGRTGEALLLSWLLNDRRRQLPQGSRRLLACGRYWDRTSDLFGVNEALSR